MFFIIFQIKAHIFDLSSQRATIQSLAIRLQIKDMPKIKYISPDKSFRTLSSDNNLDGTPVGGGGGERKYHPLSLIF